MSLRRPQVPNLSKPCSSRVVGCGGCMATMQLFCLPQGLRFGFKLPLNFIQKLQGHRPQPHRMYYCTITEWSLYCPRMVGVWLAAPVCPTVCPLFDWLSVPLCTVDSAPMCPIVCAPCLCPLCPVHQPLRLVASALCLYNRQCPSGSCLTGCQCPLYVQLTVAVYCLAVSE